MEKLTPNQAYPKIKQYCAYQERCHNEVIQKLFSFGLTKPDAEEMIGKLIEENFLNEERFAIQFAGGKFRIKNWGKTKIKYELRQKRISDYCIKKALASIDSSEYRKTFEKMALKKLQALKGEKNVFIKKRKLQDYLLMAGFEASLVKEFINEF